MNPIEQVLNQPGMWWWLWAVTIIVAPSLAVGLAGYLAEILNLSLLRREVSHLGREKFYKLTLNYLSVVLAGLGYWWTWFWPMNEAQRAVFPIGFFLFTASYIIMAGLFAMGDQVPSRRFIKEDERHRQVIYNLPPG